MSTQKQIEKLKADIATIQQCLSIYKDWRFSYSESEFRQALDEMQAKLAALEAQAAAEADPFRQAKEIIKTWREQRRKNHLSCFAGSASDAILTYIDSILTENTRLEAELAKTASTRDMAWNMLNDKNVQNAQLDGKINELEAELAKRPVVLYAGNRAYTYETCTGEQE